MGGLSSTSYSLRGNIGCPRVGSSLDRGNSYHFSKRVLHAIVSVLMVHLKICLDVIKYNP